jgi:hypothetical protein
MRLHKGNLTLLKATKCNYTAAYRQPYVLKSKQMHFCGPIRETLRAQEQANAIMRPHKGNLTLLEATKCILAAT